MRSKLFYCRNQRKRIKYIAFFEYFDKSLIVLSATSRSISIALFTTVIGEPVGIGIQVLVLNFQCLQELKYNTNEKRQELKTTQKTKKKYIKVVMLAKSKLNSIESKISEVLINNEIIHEDFMAVVNQERYHRELKESIRVMKSQSSDTKEMNLIEKGKKIGIDEVVKCNNITNNSLKSQI